MARPSICLDNVAGLGYDIVAAGDLLMCSTVIDLPGRRHHEAIRRCCRPG